MFREKIKKAWKWTKENKTEILYCLGAAASFAAGTYVTIEFVKACKAVVSSSMNITPLDVQKTDGRGGWLLMDCYEQNLYWPVEHGLNPEEIQKVSDLVETKDISTGQALMELGLLRVNC